MPIPMRDNNEGTCIVPGGRREGTYVCDHGLVEELADGKTSCWLNWKQKKNDEKYLVQINGAMRDVHHVIYLVAHDTRKKSSFRL